VNKNISDRDIINWCEWKVEEPVWYT